MERSPRQRTAHRALAAAALAAVLAAPGVAAATEVSAAGGLFAAPSGVAAVGPWVVVANHMTSGLTVISAADGSLVGRVAHATVGVGAPSSIVAGVVAGMRTVFVAGAGGRVGELTLSPSGSALVATHVRTLVPVGCTSRAHGYLAIDRRDHLVEACSNGVVTEWRASSGALVRTIPYKVTDVDKATGIALVGSDAAVTKVSTTSNWADSDNGVVLLSLTSGKVLRTVTNANGAYGFSAPGEISFDGTYLWVINTMGNTVDELTGTTLRLVGSSGTNVSDPTVVLATRSYVWVSSSSWEGGSSMVTQFDHTLSSPWMMCNTNGPYQFDNPSGFTLSGGKLWVSNQSNNLVDEMDATSGALINTFQ